MTGQKKQDELLESEATPGRLGASQGDLPLPPSAARIESWVRAIGNGLSWIWLILVAVIVLNVILRYALSEGHIELEEMQWHLYAIGFLGGLSLAVVDDRHVRVDFLRERMSPRLRAWVELYGLLLLLLPFCLLVVIFSIPFAVDAWQASEVSSSAGGLPGRWIIKSTLPLAMLLVGWAALGRLIRVGHELFGEAQSESSLRNEEL